MYSLSPSFSSSPSSTVSVNGPLACPNSGPIPDDVAAELAQHWDFERYIAYFPTVTEAGRNYLRAALKAPSRHPSGTRSVTTRVPLQKTDQTFTTESDGAELPAAIMGNHTEEVLFLVEQLGRLTLVYPSGLSTGNGHTTPDAVFFTLNGPELIEAKLHRSIARLCMTKKAQYQHINGRFISGPAIEAAAELGLTYRILTEQNYVGVFLRNLDALNPYFRADLSEPITDQEREIVRAALDAKPGSTSASLPITDASRRADIVYSLLARREIFAHLSVTSIRDHQKLRLFLTQTQERAYALFLGKEMNQQEIAIPVSRLFPLNGQFRISRVNFTVIGHRPDGILARNESTRSEDVFSYLTLQAAGVKVERSESQMAIDELIAALDETRLQAFLKNRCLIKPYLPLGRLAGQSPLRRHVRALLRKYRLAESTSGVGERGLISRIKDRGNRSQRKSDESEDVLHDLIQDVFLNKGPAPSVTFVYSLYETKAKELNFTKKDTFTYRSVAARIAGLDRYYKDLARLGARGALSLRRPSGVTSIMGAPNGAAPWAVAHIDHTLIDCLVKNPATDEFERPWISAMVDGFSGRILAVCIWFGNPSAAVVMAVLKDCLKRHGTLPQKLRVDWGSEFRSTDVQGVLASLGIQLSYRQKGDPHAGAPVETSFKSLNVRFIHNAPGNTKILRNVREATAAVQPSKFACIEHAEFLALMEDYISINNSTPRRFKLSPNDLLTAFVAVHGSHGACWLSPTLLERLTQTSVIHNTRIVSPKATIRVFTVDYGAQELESLRGEEVKVFMDRKDPRFVYFDNPNSGLRVKCPAVTSEILYAGSAEEAVAILTRRMTGSYERTKAAMSAWAPLHVKISELESAFRPATAAKPKPEAPVPPPPTPRVQTYTPVAAGITND